MELKDKYEITEFERILLDVTRKLRGTTNPPEWVYKYSRKKYGWKDNLARYYYDKFLNFPVGKYTYGYRSLKTEEIHSVGSFCSIGIDQRLVGNGHPINYVSTWNTLLDKKINPANTLKSIRIGSDVWIGAYSIIRSNLTIGDGAVIGAGSIITKDVEPYTVVVGNNRVLRQRFSDNIVESLLKMKWWEWNDDKILNSMQYWSNVEDFITRYKV